MSARDRSARVDREGDRESPEKSRPEQPGQEAISVAGDGIGDETVAQEDQNENAEHLAEVLFSPAFFGYRHSFSSSSLTKSRAMTPARWSRSPPLCTSFGGVSKKKSPNLHAPAGAHRSGLFPSCPASRCRLVHSTRIGLCQSPIRASRNSRQSLSSALATTSAPAASTAAACSGVVMNPVPHTGTFVLSRMVGITSGMATPGAIAIA